ncbi:hypothetical protein LCGC14_0318660 [marine sediment metagenome]|uniref:Uncharacterized protein n=1 Tax=marine sediment metagenome TaxID=412755 RepID=A0A0F9W7E1_9ZZZZ
MARNPVKKWTVYIDNINVGEVSAATMGGAADCAVLGFNSKLEAAKRDNEGRGDSIHVKEK